MIAAFSDHFYIIILFFLIAVLYSSVGFGGGSSYLAILTLSGILFTQMRAIALLCNIVVVTGNVINDKRNKTIDYKKIIPIIVFSIPMAYLGGYIHIEENYFFIILGFTLFIAAILMWFSNKIKKIDSNEDQQHHTKNGFIGGAIGFLSGMVGIGGGIFLAPILHLTQWDTPKKISATASAFILVNSIAGFLGQFSQGLGYLNWKLIIILLLTVFLGGQIGSRLNHKMLTPLQLKKGTAVLIAFVSVRIILKYLF